MRKLTTRLTWVSLWLCCLIGCAAAMKVTPEQRASVYQREGQAAQALCKAYLFDRSLGLTNEAPAMAKLCGKP